ncbi:DNA/RNA endonuclease G [Microbacterium sp. LWH11-1.2]|uniref:DNA/RNA endonuclease G n=1 Tax=unclassified Microbacterium TaxID=2609290 RepID=UPI0031396E3F
MSTPVLRRVVRRETHSPRTVATFVAVILLILALAYIGLEIVLSLAAQPALLLGPAAAGGWLVGLPTAQPAGAVVAGSVILALIGVVFVWLAVAPGRLSKHTIDAGDRAVVVDNGVIASALAQHLSEETGLARENITVGVGHRSVDVTLRPGAGVPLEKSAVQSAAEAELQTYRLTRNVRTRIRIERPDEKEDSL